MGKNNAGEPGPFRDEAEVSVLETGVGSYIDALVLVIRGIGSIPYGIFASAQSFAISTFL